ncbi:MAG TPA: SdrD B-like domain-containing protein [Humisphaera sp.]
MTRTTRPAAVEPLEGRRLFAAYTLEALGSIEGYTDYTATGMNNVGRVVGYADGFSTVAFVARAGGMSAVGGPGSVARAINDTGTVVGEFMTSDGDVHGFSRRGTSFTDLTLAAAAALGYGQPGQVYFGSATDINAGGTVVLNIGQSGEPTTVRYTNGTYRFVSGTTPGRVNDHAVIANHYFDPVSDGVEVTRAGRTYVLDGARVGGINNLDQVVGYVKRDERAFLYEPGGTARAFGPAGAVPADINDQGVIVGRLGELSISTDDDRAFVVRNGVVTNLNSLVALPKGVVLTDAVAVNNKGQIAVNAMNGGRHVAYLLTPSNASASVSGRVFNDANRNGRKDAGEAGLAGWRVYVDSNKDGVWNVGEQITETDAAGNYKLTNLSAGTVRVREVLVAGWAPSKPASTSANAFYDLSLANGFAATGRDFGNWKR